MMNPKVTATVHKQFNSPVGLYSTENISKTLSKHTAVLGNKAVGIDFRFLGAPNLAKSEVLKMLAEEEIANKSEGESIHGLSGGRSIGHPEVTSSVDWPPKSSIKQSPAFWSKCQTGGGVKRVAWPPPPETDIPDNFDARMSSNMDAKPQAPGSRSYIQDGPLSGQAAVPPGQTLILLEQAPVHQVPAGITPSQPVFKRRTAPTRMRGDEKWPPVAQSANPGITMSPIVRPKKVTKSYNNFFSKNSLQPTYPSYRAPPGTQHCYQ